MIMIKLFNKTFVMKGFTLIAITLIILTINLIMLLQTLMLKMLFNLNTTTLTNYKIWKYLTKINHWLISYNLKAYSLKINFDDLHLLSSINKNFAVIAMTETRITKNVSLTNNLTMSIFLLSSPLLNPQQVVPFFILLITHHINLAWT